MADPRARGRSRTRNPTASGCQCGEECRCSQTKRMIDRAAPASLDPKQRGRAIHQILPDHLSRWKPRIAGIYKFVRITAGKAPDLLGRRNQGGAPAPMRHWLAVEALSRSIVDSSANTAARPSEPSAQSTTYDAMLRGLVRRRRMTTAELRKRHYHPSRHSGVRQRPRRVLAGGLTYRRDRSYAMSQGAAGTLR